MNSWKTTILGIIGGLMLLLPQISAVIDDDPDTNPSYESIIAALSVMGVGVSARDHGMTSEKAGAKK